MAGADQEDRTTIEKVLVGDYLAFEALVEKYQGRIYRHLRKMVKDNHVAEDLLQETFLNAYRGLKEFEGGSSFSTWLFRIATNNALMFLRKHKPHHVEYDDEIRTDPSYAFMTVSPEFADTPLEVLLSQEGRSKIEEAIDALPTLYRSVLILRDIEGFSLSEVAEILNSSVPAVRSRLHRARNAARELLMTYYMDKDLSTSQGVS